MKILHRFGLFAVALILSTQVFATGHDLKIGVVNMRDLVQRSPDAAKIAKKLEGEFEPRKQRIISLQNEIKETANKVQRDGSIMKETERKRVERELVEKQRELVHLDEAFREDGQTRQQEETEQLLRKISEVIAEIGKKEGFDIIIHREAAPFVRNDMDITQKVLRAMGTKS